MIHLQQTARPVNQTTRLAAPTIPLQHTQPHPNRKPTRTPHLPTPSPPIMHRTRHHLAARTHRTRINHHTTLTTLQHAHNGTTAVGNSTTDPKVETIARLFSQPLPPIREVIHRGPPPYPQAFHRVAHRRPRRCESATSASVAERRAGRPHRWRVTIAPVSARHRIRCACRLMLPRQCRLSGDWSPGRPTAVRARERGPSTTARASRRVSRLLLVLASSL